MVKLYKIKFIKDTELKKEGEIGEATKKNADGFVKAGYAEYIEEPKKEEVKIQMLEIEKSKPIKVKKEKTVKEPKVEKPIPNFLEAHKQIESILDKPTPEQDTLMYEIAKKTNVSWSKLNGYRAEILKSKQEIKIETPKKEIPIYTDKELEEKGLIEYTETDEEFRARQAKFYADKFTQESLIKSGIIKWIEYNPQYKLDIKCRVLSLLDQEEFDRATELIVMEVKKFFHIYTIRSDLTDEILVYDDGIYVPEGKSYIMEFCRKVLGVNYRDSISKAVIDKIMLDTLIAKEKLYGTTNINEIPVQNGILDIFKLELKPFTPEKIFFNKLPVKYDVTQQCPKIEQFLKDIVSKEDDIKVFYELAGFSLLKDYKFEKAFMFVGDGRNGKTKSIELLKRLVGIDNCSALTLTMLNPEQSDISQLHNKFLNIAGDIGNQDLKDTSMFKSLTGRDLISGRRKYKTNIHFQNYAKFIFSCNELPMVYDMTKGFWDRWILLEFPYTFVPEQEWKYAIIKGNLKIRDEGIIEKISTPQEMSGLLNQAILGLHRLLENKGFSFTMGTEEVKSKWIRKSNSFMAFCYDHIEEDSEGYITKKDLRKKYSEFCKLHKIPSKSDVILKRVLQDNYGVIDERKDLLNGFYEWCWVGIKWKN